MSVDGDPGAVGGTILSSSAFRRVSNVRLLLGEHFAVVVVGAPVSGVAGIADGRVDLRALACFAVADDGAGHGVAFSTQSLWRAVNEVEPGSDLEWESLLSDHGSGIFEVDAVLRRRRMWRVTEPVLVERKERVFRWRSRVEMAS